MFDSLEEPPFSKTEQMGSYVHAKSVQSQKDKIKGVYILEMIGFFSEQPIQSYPVGLKWIYPSHGNFIATVSNVSSRDLGAGYRAVMQQLDLLECQRLVAPSFANAFDFSDHLNYWEFDIPAVMITDTGILSKWSLPYQSRPLSDVEFDQNGECDRWAGTAFIETLMYFEP